MDRVDSSLHREAIGRVLTWLPKPMYQLVKNTHFFSGDGVYAGITNYQYATDGRSYKDTSHYLSPYHLKHMPADQRCPTIVLDKDAGYWVVMHEIGHALHEALEHSWCTRPINEYAQTDMYEAFAESFCAWRYPRYEEGIDLRQYDPSTHHYFENLAAGRPSQLLTLASH